MPSPDPHGLRPLLERSLNGDLAARNDLLGRLRSYLKVRVRSWLGADLARRLDDSSLAQESLVRIQKGWDDFRGRSVPELLGWARRIAYNVTLDRKKALIGSARGGALPDVADSGPSPLAALANAEDALRLAKALEQLPGPRRAVVVGRLIDGLSFEELARKMGKTNGALRVLFKRAVEQLRQSLRDES